MNIDVRFLHPLELKVLFHAASHPEFTTTDLQAELNLLEGQVNQAISWLLSKSLIGESAKRVEQVYERTALGKSWEEQGIPARRMVEHLKTVSEGVELQKLPAILQCVQKDVGSSFGQLQRHGVVRMDEQKRIVLQQKAELPEDMLILEKLLHKESVDIASLDEKHTAVLTQHSKKRGAGSVPFRHIEKETITYSLLEQGYESVSAPKSLGLTGEELGQLSAQMLRDKSWVGKTFRAYTITLPPNRVTVGRRNPYARFLQQIKNNLVALGFEEFDGSLVETEFWNSDALFMPQFHSARDVHDVYYLSHPTHAKSIEEPWLSNVAAAHEHGGNTGSRGWRYSFDKEFTKRLILRSQGTVMSAKTLPTAKIPGKYFGILRVFRRDQVDATHLSDFYQTEGIVLGEDVNLCTLLGLLRVFAEELAQAKEVRYVPGYFPFTEPSVEVHIRHPQIGWMELGGSGIFRPEVTKPLGIDVPVAAWGIGIDRMATMQMGISDLRELFSYDLERVLMRKDIL